MIGPRLPPPLGYSTWLDYAVACMDTRSLEQEELFIDDPAQRHWPEGTTREQMEEAVKDELAELRARVIVDNPVQKPKREVREDRLLALLERQEQRQDQQKNRIGVARGVFDLPDNAETNRLPPTTCPGCGQKVGNRLIAFNAGALRRDGPNSASIGDDLLGFMHFIWHDHDQLGLPHVDVAENSAPGQIELYFHGTACLRKWFAEIANRLEVKP